MGHFLTKLLLHSFLSIILMYSMPAFADQACKKIVTIGVIDTGVDPNHEAIKKHLWKDPENYGIYGYDLVYKKYNPIDLYGHGTHVAGLILSMSPCIKILPISYYKEKDAGEANLNRLVDAIYYAISKNVDIINYSGGGRDFEEKEYVAILEAKSRGIFFVTAAGNEKINVDSSNRHFYPASYVLENIISVTAVDQSDELLKKSNWGKRSIDFATQGFKLVSSLPNNEYGEMTGTSMATALVSGYMGKILSNSHKKISFEKMRVELYKTVRRVDGLKEKIKSAGVLDLYKERSLSEDKN